MEHLKSRTVREWLDLIPFENARKASICQFNKYCNKYNQSHFKVVDRLSEALMSISWAGNFGLIAPQLCNSVTQMEHSVKLK